MAKERGYTDENGEFHEYMSKAEVKAHAQDCGQFVDYVKSESKIKATRARLTIKEVNELFLRMSAETIEPKEIKRLQKHFKFTEHLLVKFEKDQKVWKKLRTACKSVPTTLRKSADLLDELVDDIDGECVDAREMADTLHSAMLKVDEL